MTKTEARVLAWVNRLRKEHNIGVPLDALPAGDHSCLRCPIARALHAKVGLYQATLDHWDGEKFVLQMPSYVTAWIDCFDSGAYKHLIAAA